MSTDPEFHVERVERDDAEAVVYRMHGVLGDTHHCYEFLESYLAALDGSPARIVFNLTDMENMYSAGIGIVANCFTKTKAAGKSLVLCGVPEIIHRTLTITGIQPMVKDFATEDEAVHATDA